MAISIKRHLFWIIYSAWSMSVFLVNWHDTILAFNKPQVFGKILVWLTFFGFSAYTIYCSWTEKFFKSLKQILIFKWGKQIGLDLTIGLLIFSFFVFWHSGSLLTTFLWLIPFICFGNLASLLYLCIHYDAIVNLFSH